MYYIVNKNNVISMNRGDYAEIPLYFKEGKFPYNTPITMTDDDVLFFGLMDPNQHFEHALLKKEYTGSSTIDKDGKFLLVLEPEDTLELMPGTYFYEIKLLTKDSKIYTLMQKTRFNIID